MKLLLLLVVSVLAPLVRAEPIYFKPEGWAVGTVFPAEPKLTESRSPKPEGDIVESRAVYETASAAFELARVHNPGPIPPARIPAAYNGAKNSLLRSMGATLISEKDIEILGHDARRYVVSVNKGEITCEIRLLIMGDDLYLFTYLHPREELSTPEADAFFEKISDAEKTE